MVFAHPYVFSRMVYRSSLAYYYIAGFGKLSAENFYSKSFAF